MTWQMPAELVPLAGVFALVVAWPRLSKPPSHARLLAEVVMIALGTIAACSVARRCTGGSSNAGETCRPAHPGARSFRRRRPGRC